MYSFKQKKLDKLVELKGFKDDDELAKEFMFDSLCPGICMNPNCDCIYITGADQRNGWCDNCKTDSVESVLSLMGLI